MRDEDIAQRISDSQGIGEVSYDQVLTDDEVRADLMADFGVMVDRNDLSR